MTSTLDAGGGEYQAGINLLLVLYSLLDGRLPFAVVEDCAHRESQFVRRGARKGHVRGRAMAHENPFLAPLYKFMALHPRGSVRVVLLYERPLPELPCEVGHRQ